MGDFGFDSIGQGLDSKDLGSYLERVKLASQELLADPSTGAFKLNRLLRALPIGDPAYSYSNMLYGINHRYYLPLIPIDKLNKGYVFFTRPQLNLGDRNIANNSTFIALKNNQYLSLYNYIRCLLDPRIASGLSVEMGQSSIKPGVSPYLNQELIFMSLFTNTIKTLSGWPDPNMPTYTSKENMRGGVHRMVDGIMQTYGSFELTATFRNYLGNPLLAVIWYWLNYMSAVYDGTLTPYADMLAANEIDYNTRIWRIVMDEENRFVRMIGATGASFPVSTDIGKFFNLNDSEDLVTDHQELTVTFACIGATYLESVLVDEFNKAVCIGKPALTGIRNNYLLGMTTPKDKANGMERIPNTLIDRFNYRGYPLINYNTMELEWWIDSSEPAYGATLRELKRGLYAIENPPAPPPEPEQTPVEAEAAKRDVSDGENPEKAEKDATKDGDANLGTDWVPPKDDKQKKDIANVFNEEFGLNKEIFNPHPFGTKKYREWEAWANKGFPKNKPKVDDEEAEKPQETETEVEKPQEEQAPEPLDVHTFTGSASDSYGDAIRI